MKTIYTLSTIVLIALSLNSSADDKIKNRNKSTTVAVAPFAWGDPENEVPVELNTLKAKNAGVPVAPFVWGSPDEFILNGNDLKIVVPVAPFNFGEAGTDIPEGLNYIKAKNARVPVAPFVWGNAEEAAPVL